MTFSDELEQILAPYRGEYRDIVNSWISEGDFHLSYPAFLVETFHYVKHSCSLMSLACSKLGTDQIELQKYLAKHIAEEVGHDEWVLDDLQELGYKRELIEGTTPLSETINLIGSQLYIINYLSPTGLMGYVYVMESQPPSQKFLDFLQTTYKIPSKALTTLARHGELDLEHRIELKNVLDNLIIEEKDKEAVIMSATVGLSNANKLLRRLKAGNYTSYLPELQSRKEEVNHFH